MGYFTGTANNSSDIIAGIVAACLGDGWTQSGSILSKDGCHVRLTAPNANQVRVEGANDAGFTDVCPWSGYSGINVWPVSYRIWTNSDPCACFVHIRQADQVTYQHIMFGEIENKVGTWTGGNFFSASRTVANAANYTAVGIFSGYYGQYTNIGISGGPFIGGDASYTWQPSADGIHCELPDRLFPAQKWANSAVNTGSTGYDCVMWPMAQTPLNWYQPNLWNGQVILLQPHLYITRPGGRQCKIGTLPHIRALRITNYEPYDIITLGEEQWMVAPWTRKDTVHVDGSAGLGQEHSGTHGFAVRYTP